MLFRSPSFITKADELDRQAEANPDILGLSDKDVVALGFCAGLLPAAVAAACRSAADIIDIGIVVVTVSCRLATEISRRSRMIEPAPGCWGYSMIGVSLKDLEACLGLFHRAKVSVNRSSYILGIDKCNTAHSGPQKSLRRRNSIGLVNNLRASFSPRESFCILSSSFRSTEASITSLWGSSCNSPANAGIVSPTWSIPPTFYSFKFSFQNHIIKPLCTIHSARPSIPTT